jgi:Spy/CpxP family protein refolding chaperone
MLDRLNLSEDQRAQIDAIVSERREAMRAKLDQMRERHLALMEAVHGEPFDEAAIRDAAAAAAVTQADLAVERAMTLAEVRGVLTPEQREQAQQMFEQRQERARSGDRGFYREHRHRGHGPGDEAARELED